MAHDLPTLTDGTVTLRPPRPADVAARFALGRDAEVLAGYGSDPAHLPPWSQAQAEAWVERRQARGFWMIERDGALTGETGFEALNRRDARAIVTIGLLSAAMLGQGTGRRALTLLLSHGFEAIGLHRVGLRVLATNLRAIRCYTALGFVQEGREREAAKTPGGRVDDLMMGLLVSEWRAGT